MGECYQYHNQQLQLHQQRQQAGGSSRLGLRVSGGGGGGEIVEVHGGHIVRSTSRKDRHSKVCTSKGPRDRRVRLSAPTAIQFYDLQDRLGYDRPSKAVDWLIKKAKTAIDELAELPAWKPTNVVTTITNPNSTSTADFHQNPDQFNHFDQHPDDILDNPIVDSSRTSNRRQDLSLSLQSFQDPILQNHHHPQQAICFDGSGWSNNQPGDAFSGGFVFSSPAPSPSFLQPLFGQTITNELFNNNSQREPLQSSTTPSFRAWIDPLPPFTGDQHPTLAFHRPSSGLGGFSGFRVPARIQGEEEGHDGICNRPSSASSDSRH